MINSKLGKVFCLIVIALVLFGIGFCVFNFLDSKSIQLTDVQNEQISDSNTAQVTPAEVEPVKEEALNPVQKYYKDNLKQDVIDFLNNAKTPKDNDLEFNKLQMKLIKATDVLNEKYTENIDIKDPYYKNNWVKLPCIEGIYFYSVNSEYLLEKYGKYLSSAYNEWLKFTIKRENVMQDGGFIVPPDKLREYIIFLEKFTEQNSEFILISDAEDILKSYLMTYLEGLDNSPIFDKWNSKKMQPEFKESYEKFLSENKDSKYYPMVEELYNKSKENDFTWDKSFEDWAISYHKKYFAD